MCGFLYIYKRNSISTPTYKHIYLYRHTHAHTYILYIYTYDKLLRSYVEIKRINIATAMGSQFFFHFPFQLHIIGLADGIVSTNTQSTYIMLCI